MPEIQELLLNNEELKAIVSKNKETDSFYLEKRDISQDYNPLGAYDFRSWQDLFDDNIRQRYESLHTDLLTYLQRYEPDELVYDGGDNYHTRTH